MTTTLDAYRAFLKEIDKWESPSCSVGDFVYLFNAEIDKYIASNYATFDINQKTLDDLSAILNLGESLVFANSVAALPAKYRHVLGLEAVLKFTVAVDGNAINDEITVYPKRMRTNRKGFASENAYQQPSYKSTFFQVTKGNVKLLHGVETSVSAGKLDYLEIPETMYLNPDTTVDYDDPDNNTLLQFPPHVNYEIIQHCRVTFLENIESRRYQTSLQETALRKE